MTGTFKKLYLKKFCTRSHLKCFSKQFLHFSSNFFKKYRISTWQFCLSIYKSLEMFCKTRRLSRVSEHVILSLTQKFFESFTKFAMERNLGWSTEIKCVSFSKQLKCRPENVLKASEYILFNDKYWFSHKIKKKYFSQIKFKFYFVRLPFEYVLY